MGACSMMGGGFSLISVGALAALYSVGPGTVVGTVMSIKRGIEYCGNMAELSTQKNGSRNEEKLKREAEENRLSMVRWGLSAVPIIGIPLAMTV